MNRLEILVLAVAAILGIGFGSAFTPSPKLIWNASASAPIGFYAVLPNHPLKDGDFVIAMPPDTLAALFAARHYLPKGVPLLKHIAALPGQIVCRLGSVVAIDGIAIASALIRDRVGRPLPNWQGCRAISANEIFLLNRSVPDSLDGRYFGPLPMASLIGRAKPLWTFTEP
ncbi:MAG TPA: S26 family signal peptidase [Rhizomicrobium sp.]